MRWNGDFAAKARMLLLRAPLRPSSGVPWSLVPHIPPDEVGDHVMGRSWKWGGKTATAQGMVRLRLSQRLYNWTPASQQSEEVDPSHSSN